MKSFKESVSQDAPDPQLSIVLKSLWYDAKGDWANLVSYFIKKIH
jgi:hypothetical protein